MKYIQVKYLISEVDSTNNLIKAKLSQSVSKEFPVKFHCDDEADRKRIISALILQDLMKTKASELNQIGQELFSEGVHDRDIDYLQSAIEDLIKESEK